MVNTHKTQVSMTKKLGVLVLLALPLSGVAFANNAADLKGLERQAITSYAKLVAATYDDALLGVKQLDKAIGNFVQRPTAAGLEAAKDAWLAAREPYGQTEVFRFYNGPIDDVEGYINAWPLDESYVDYVAGDPSAGLIQDVQGHPKIDEGSLRALNEQGGEENIATGFHALEFILWGQDLSDKTAGQRPLTDFTSDKNALRRKQYLQQVSAMLVKDLAAVAQQWQPGEDNYRRTFEALPQGRALTEIFTGMGVLTKSELAGERIFTAYDNQDQEDEHSCFSDNTDRDIINNLQGIVNVYEGRYVRTSGEALSGTGIAQLLAAKDPALAKELSAMFAAAQEEADALPTPFDQAIINTAGRAQVLELVMGLTEAGDKVAEASSVLGLTIDTSLPE